MPRTSATLLAPVRDGRLVPLIAQLHGAVDLDGFWKASLRLLDTLVPHHSCSLLYGIVDTHRLHARHRMPGTRAARRSVTNLAIVQAFLARHPGIKAYTFAQVLAEDPGAQERRLAQQSRHQETWEDFVHLAFWDGKRPDAVLSVRRGRSQGPFTRAEMEFLKNLHPIIEAGLQRLRRLSEERSQHLSIERFLAEIPVAVLFLDAQLKLIYASREGYAACARWNYGEKSARRLNPRRSFVLPPALIAACSGLLAGSSNPTNGRKLRIPHPTRAPLAADVTVDAPRSSSWTRPVYRIVFRNESAPGATPFPPKPATLLLLQPLTPQERSVALLAVEGCSNRTIAARLAKSARTVESQLTEIYRKLGVSNRVQLTRIMA